MLAGYDSDDESELKADIGNDVVIWKECVDRRSGKVYYWNPATNEVQWNSPIELPAVAASIPVQSSTMEAPSTSICCFARRELSDCHR